MAVPSTGCLIRSWFPRNWKRWGSCWPIWPRRNRANKFLEPQLMGSVLSFLLFLWLGLLRWMLRVWFKKLYSKAFKVSSDDRNHFAMALSSHFFPRRHSSRRITCFPMFRPSSIYIIFNGFVFSKSVCLYQTQQLWTKLLDGPGCYIGPHHLPGVGNCLGWPGSLWHKEMAGMWKKALKWTRMQKEWKNRWGPTLYYYRNYTSTLPSMVYQRILEHGLINQIEGSSSSLSAKKANTNRRTNFFHARRVTRFMTMMYAEVLPNTSGVKFGVRLLVFDAGSGSARLNDLKFLALAYGYCLFLPKPLQGNNNWPCLRLVFRASIFWHVSPESIQAWNSWEQDVFLGVKVSFDQSIITDIYSTMKLVS